MCASFTFVRSVLLCLIHPPTLQARDKCFKTAKSNKARDKKAAYRAKGIELQKAAAEKKAAK